MSSLEELYHQKRGNVFVSLHFDPGVRSRAAAEHHEARIVRVDECGGAYLVGVLRVGRRGAA